MAERITGAQVDLDPENTEFEKLREQGAGWTNYAFQRIKQLETRLGRRLLPGQTDEASDFVGGLVDFLTLTNIDDAHDGVAVTDEATRLFVAVAEEHNFGAWMAELGIAFANRGRLDAAENLAEIDGPVVEEYRDQVLLAIAASYGRAGDKDNALEYMIRASCTGHGGINGTNLIAFDRVFSELVAADVAVPESPYDPDDIPRSSLD